MESFKFYLLENTVMQSPWTQHNTTFQEWLHRALLKDIQTAQITASAKRPLLAASVVHRVFLASTVGFPELWFMRKRYYREAVRILIEIWCHAEERDDAFGLVFACPLLELRRKVDAVESACRSEPWRADVLRLRCLLGLGVVEIAEILNLPETAVQRQSLLPSPQDPVCV
jgi:hypothetical protein